MTAPLMSSIVAVLFALLGYVAGRAHQWRRGGWDREQAYRDGYDEATRSTLSMAARIATAPPPPPASSAAPVVVPVPPPVPSFPAPVSPPLSFPVAPEPDFPEPDVAFFEPVTHEPAAADEVPVPRLGRRGRHYAPDELVQAATYRLPADRVARANVPPPSSDNPIPKPRSS